MTNAEKEIIERQSQYLHLINKLTQIKLSGEKPPKELIKQALEVGRAAHIPDFLLKLI
jgi:hypothetical protein